MATGLSNSLNIARNAITNNQYGLQIVSNNVANMNTVGYSRQAAHFSSVSGYNTYNYASHSQYLIGGGASLDNILRNRDQLMDNRYRAQAPTAGFYSQIGTMTSNLESHMNELNEKGLQTSFANFFKAADMLTDDPSNTGYRIAYTAALQEIADKFNKTATTIKNSIKEAVGEVGDAASFSSSKVKTVTDDLNSKLHQVAELNQQILINQTTKGPANELLDKRDMLLDEISAIVPIDIKYNTNNTVNIEFNNMTFIDGNKQYFQFQAVQGTDDDKPVVMQVVNMDTPPQVFKKDVTDKIDTGILGAIISSAGARTVDGVNYSTVLKQLDELAAAFAEKMNEIQTQVIGGKTPLSIDANGELTAATEPLFTSSDGQPFSAYNIRVNDNIINNPNAVAAARADITDPDFDPLSIGNALNMDLVTALKTEKLSSLSSIGGAAQSLNDFLTSMTSTVGNIMSNINAKAETQTGIMSQIDLDRTSLYGVNLDEEMADLIKYQRAYEAAARVFNTTSEMMQVMVNLGR